MKPADELIYPSALQEEDYKLLSGPGKILQPVAASARFIIDRKRSYFIVKRCFDIIISLLFIITILSWLIPLLALCIKVTSRGPVFFLQRRVGLGGKSFTCIKLRTMVLNGKADTQEALENDERITRLGRFLRISNLDEFPQFFNVLTGSMSIVGPRPHMHADCTRYATIVHNYKFRSFVKPGITGLSQVKGYHGRVINRDCIAARYYWDAYYVRNAGFMMDLRIIAITAVQRIRFLIQV